MDITLNQDEIEKAVREFIGNQGISISNKLVEISLTAGRGPNGHSASVTILSDPDSGKNVKGPEPVEEVTPEPEKKAAKKPGPKAKATKKDKEVKEVLEENTDEFKEQEDETGFELTEAGPVEEPEMEMAEAGADGEEDSLFGS